jgi:hypothetical protein
VRPRRKTNNPELKITITIFAGFALFYMEIWHHPQKSE